MVSGAGSFRKSGYHIRQTESGGEMRILLFAALWPEVRGLVRIMGMRARQSQLPYRQYQDERGEVLFDPDRTGAGGCGGSSRRCSCGARPGFACPGRKRGGEDDRSICRSLSGQQTDRRGREKEFLPGPDLSLRLPPAGGCSVQPVQNLDSGRNQDGLWPKRGSERGKPCGTRTK